MIHKNLHNKANKKETKKKQKDVSFPRRKMVTMAAAMIMAMVIGVLPQLGDDDPVSRPTVSIVTILCYNIF